MSKTVESIKKSLLFHKQTINSLNNNDRYKWYIDDDIILYYINECEGKLKYVPAKYLVNSQKVLDAYISKNKESESFLIDFGLDRFNLAFRRKMINLYFKTIFPKFTSMRMISSMNLVNYIFSVVPKEIARDIPERFKSREFYTILFKKNKKIGDIPENYRTAEMYRYAFLHDYDEDINRVPTKFRNQKMYNKAFRDEKILFDDIPIEYRTQNLYNYYFLREKDLDKIPEEFINSSLFGFYLKKSRDSHDFDIYLVPEIFRTKAMFFEAYSNGTIKFKDIPSNCYSRELCEKYFEDSFDLGSIPASLCSQDMCNRYFTKTDDITVIPNKFVNQFLFNHYYMYSMRPKGEVIRLIPEKFRTEKMFYNPDVIGNAIDLIPEEYKTKELFDYYFKTCFSIRFDITIIPLEFLTQEMCNVYYEHHSDCLNNIPECFINDELLSIHADDNKKRR